MSARVANSPKWRFRRWRSRLLCALLLAPLLQLAVAHAQSLPAIHEATTQLLLLDGVRAFRGERYEEALAIFRRIEAAQAPADIGFYLGMTLHKLGRHAEALVVFRAAHRAGLREPVADYYQAVSCHRLGLFMRAQQGFSALLAGAKRPAEANTPPLGPRLQQGARSFLEAIEQPLADPAQRLQRYEAALSQAATLPAGSEEEALEWVDEAVQLFAQLPGRAEHLPVLRQALLRLRNALRGKPAHADVMALWAQSGA